MNLPQQVLSDITVHTKYAKYIPELKRRETWEEIVTRNKEMHQEKYPALYPEIEQAYKLVYEKKVLPSMRSMQFAGKPIELNNARIFNCSYAPVDDYRVFSEIMFLLLSGCGVGYSVQNHHIDRLPEIKVPTRQRRYLVGDSIEGWADAIRMLCKAYFGYTNALPLFDFRDIRPKGARLITSGGKAPGAEPLKECLFQVQKIFDRKQNGQKLTSIEAHDIICHLADAVLSGGIRRAALIALFDFDDQDMLTCKFGEWWTENPQRGRANNSAVILRHKITEEEFYKLWEKIEASNSGEPGFLFSNDKDFGTNPCLTEDTWVMTPHGPSQIKDLIGVQTALLKDGKFYSTTDLGFVKTGHKPVYTLTLTNGLEIRATSNHQFLKQDGEWCELGNLKEGDILKLSNNISDIEWEGTGGSEEEGWLLGNLIGDGTFGNSTAVWAYWGEDKIQMRQVAKEYLQAVVRTPLKQREYGIEHSSIHPSHNNVHISSQRFVEVAEKWGVTQGNKHFTTKIETGGSDFYKGVLGGFFDADGSVWGNNQTGLNVSLAQNHLLTLQIIQRMLYRLGIESTLYKVCEAGTQLMPDGKGGLKEYKVQEGWELRISGRKAVELFFNTLHIKSILKLRKYSSEIEKYSKSVYSRKSEFTSAIKSITLSGTEDVYDCTVPEVSCFDANGIIAHNCAEIALKPFQFCNLCEINASDIGSQEDLDNRARVAAFIGTLQASYTDFHYLRDVWKRTTERDALLGVGMTGIASGEVIKYNLRQAAKVAKEENERVADILGINKAARVTTVKPSGTSSMVLGCSSGIHAWHDEYYIRRMRLGKNEALYTYLVDNHPSLIEDEIFKPHIQAVVSIPQQAPSNAILRSESATDLLERVKRFNVEWVKAGHRSGANTNNVSCTITVKPEEWPEVGKWMWENRNYYSALSVLPADLGTYKQAPFETITEEEYNTLANTLHSLDMTQVVEESDETNLMDQVACAGAVCEIV